MLKVIRSLLLKIVDDIDAGNSNITEGEAMKMMVSWMCLILEAIGLVTGSETLA